MNAGPVAELRREKTSLIAVLRGDVDLNNSPELRVTLLEAMGKSPTRQLVLNLHQVMYMDSSAIAVLVEMLQKLRKGGGRVVLSNVQPRVRGLLEIARLDSIFALVADEADAGPGPA